MVVNFQLGKSEIDENYIETLRVSFKRHDVIKIKVLKSCTRDKEEIRKISELISKKLETDRNCFKFKIIGFTIVLIKLKNHGKNTL